MIIREQNQHIKQVQLAPTSPVTNVLYHGSFAGGRGVKWVGDITPNSTMEPIVLKHILCWDNIIEPEPKPKELFDDPTDRPRRYVSMEVSLRSQRNESIINDPVNKLILKAISFWKRFIK